MRCPNGRREYSDLSGPCKGLICRSWLTLPSESNPRLAQQACNRLKLALRLSMATPASLIPELEEVISHGTAERRAETLRRITSLFVDGASHYNEEHVGLF